MGAGIRDRLNGSYAKSMVAGVEGKLDFVRIELGDVKSRVEQIFQHRLAEMDGRPTARDVISLRDSRDRSD